MTDHQCGICKNKGCLFKMKGMTNSGYCYGYEPPTNADRIRGMTDEELARFLWKQNGNNRYWKSVGKYLDWLKAETEGTE